MTSNDEENKTPNNKNEMRDEYFASIREAYKNKSSKFNQVILIWVGFTVIFLFLILLPYYSTQIKNNETANLLDRITKEITSLKEQIKPYETAKGGIENLRQNISEFPSVVREYIDSFGQGEMSVAQQGPITETFTKCNEFQSINESLFKKCNVIEKAKELFNNYNSTLFEQVISPLTKIDSNAQKKIDINTLKSKTNELQNSFNKSLSSTPEISEFYPSKLTLRDQLEREVNNYWNEYAPFIETQIQDIGPGLTRLMNEKENLTNTLKTLNSTKEQIEKRIGDIEFPFGKLPIGINESIYLFPIGIVIGFIFIVLLLSEKFELRQELYQHYRSTDNDKKILNESNLHKILPIWIDNLGSLRSRFFKFLLLLLPFIIFLISWIIIDNLWKFDSTSIDNIILGDKFLNRSIYQVSYIIILAIFIYGYIKLIKDYKKHKIKMT